MYALIFPQVGVNRNKPDRWKDDTRRSVDFYNNWFLEFAPKTFRDSRKESTEQIQDLIAITFDMTNFSPQIIIKNPKIISGLRMCMAPPIAQDRLVGLAQVKKHLVKSMEVKSKIPPKYKIEDVREQILAMANVFEKLIDVDLFVWLKENRPATLEERYRAATVVADRLTGAVSNPIIRNEQERRQINKISKFLLDRNYRELSEKEREDWLKMPPKTFGFHVNVSVDNPVGNSVNIPIDVVIQTENKDEKPILIEAKSAGDFTNVNKRKKEEAQKMTQLRNTYGNVNFVLFLCGYFNTSYLGYEAAEGIDWVWEHRIEDLIEFGI